MSFTKIALKSPAGGGKDWLARQFAEAYDFLPMAFAAPIKQIAALGLATTTQEVEFIKEGGRGQEQAGKMRKLLQEIGTECFRAYDENVWVNNLIKRVDDAHRGRLGKAYQGVVITDTRFRNEVDALLENGFTLVWMDCPEEYYRVKPSDPRWNHPSERDLDAYKDKFHLHIYNDRKKSADELMNEIFAIVDK